MRICNNCRFAKNISHDQIGTLASVQDNDGLVREFNNKMKSDNGNDVDKLMKEYIKAYKKALRRVKPSPKKYIFPVIATAASIVGGAIAGGSLFVPGIGFGIMLGIASLAKLGMDSEYLIIRKNYRNTHLYEEYWCDLFAGMYNLPPFLSSTAAMKMVEKTQGNGIVVHLDEVEEARKVLDLVELTDIAFNDNAVDIEGKLKVC